MLEKIDEVGGHKEKAGGGSSTPVIETMAVGARADVVEEILSFSQNEAEPPGSLTERI